MKDEKLVVLREWNSVTEAEMAKSILDGAGIFFDDPQRIYVGDLSYRYDAGTARGQGGRCEAGCRIARQNAVIYYFAAIQGVREALKGPRIPYERLGTTSVACDFRTVRRRGGTAYRKRRFIASGPENEVVGNETGFDKIGRAVSEDLSVPDGPRSFRLPYEHVESVARVLPVALRIAETAFRPGCRSGRKDSGRA